MRDYIDVTGKNEDEAISKALAQLGLDRDDVSVEVLERAKSGFLGIGSSPARVRVYHGPEEEPAPAEEAPPDALPESAPAGEGEASPLLQPPPIRVRRLGGKATAVFGTLCLIAAIIIFYFSVFKGSERQTPAPMDELGQDRIVITGNLKWEPIE